MAAVFEYNVASWKPEVDYEVSGREGDLRISQPNASAIGVLGETRHVWDLELTDEVPLAFEVDMCAGKSDFDLSGLDVSSLRIDGAPRGRQPGRSDSSATQRAHIPVSRRQCSWRSSVSIPPKGATMSRQEVEPNSSSKRS